MADENQYDEKIPKKYEGEFLQIDQETFVENYQVIEKEFPCEQDIFMLFGKKNQVFIQDQPKQDN